MTFTSGFSLRLLVTLRDVIAVSLKSRVQIPAMLLSVMLRTNVLCVCVCVCVCVCARVCACARAHTDVAISRKVSGR